ncbi:hypothetical protein [Streptomyces syringium]|uniref:hypothetical protein n=1 Tax=Streptomyces syringium TaxID=76729 RepID=UPI0033BE667C
MRTVRRTAVNSVISCVSLATALTLLGSASPAFADTDGATRAAAVVEQATGTGDLAPSEQATGSAAKTTTSTEAGTVTVTAPRVATGDVKATAADGTSLSLQMAKVKDVTGVRAGSGTVVYSDVATSTDLAVQPTTDGGARTLITLKNAAAPTEQRFTLTLPKDARVIPDATGGYHVVKPAGQGVSVTVGAIEAPWAKDAHGKPVATSYKLDGNQLIQQVETNKDTAFPVVADPKITWGNVTGTAYFTKGETKAIAQNGALTAMGTWALPPGLNIYVSSHAAAITTTAIKARSADHCLKLKFAAGLFIPGEYSGGCN